MRHARRVVRTKGPRSNLKCARCRQFSCRLQSLLNATEERRRRRRRRRGHSFCRTWGYWKQHATHDPLHFENTSFRKILRLLRFWATTAGRRTSFHKAGTRGTYIFIVGEKRKEENSQKPRPTPLPFRSIPVVIGAHGGKRIGKGSSTWRKVVYGWHPAIWHGHSLPRRGK